jgi:L-threonylcarbamoyladenylate synthase
MMFTMNSSLNDFVKPAALALKAGNLVVFPTETVYGLGADATNQAAVTRIYEVKDRPANHPLIVHISSANTLDKWAREIPEYAKKLAAVFWPGPMTLILPKTDLVRDFISGSQDSVGVRVPSHTVALALLKEFELLGGLGIAAPSANRFGKLSPTTVMDAQSELASYLKPADLILDGGPSLVGVESTIINCTQNSPSILRPGAITPSMIDHLLGTSVEIKTEIVDNQIKAPGLLESHYAPLAKVFLSGTPQEGDGFIALATIKTPGKAIRLASPISNEEFAQILYKALRLADSKKIEKVFVVQPEGKDIAIAINDRLKRCAFKVQST